LEMAHGFVWRLTCDAVLRIGSQEAQTALQEYLSLYHWTPILGHKCPNFAYHFKVASDWPTCPSSSRC
jgi:hypothetical protein